MSRIGPRMQHAATFVANNPGCSMFDVARAVGPNGSLKYGYDIVHRAMAADLIDVAKSPTDGRLGYTVEYQHRGNAGQRRGYGLYVPECLALWSLIEMDRVEGPLPARVCDEHTDCLASTALAMSCAAVAA